MKNTSWLLSAALAACSAPSPARPTAASSPVAAPPLSAWVGATLFDGSGRDPIPDAVLLLQADRITTVGKRGEVAIPPEAQVVDVTGKWIVPGLIDAHIHFFQSGGLYTRPDIVDLRAVRPYAEEARRVREGVGEAWRRTLASGVTAVVDLGGPMWNFEVRARARETLEAPRVAVAGPLISTVAREILDDGDPPIIKVETIEQALALVDRQLAQAPDWIKIWLIVTPERDADASAKLVQAVVERSHAAGKRVAVHATELASAKIAVRAGADLLAHSIDDALIDDAFAAELAARHIPVIPTLVVYRGYAEALTGELQLDDFERRRADPTILATFGELRAASPAAPAQAADRKARLLGKAPIMRENLLKLWRAGVVIAAGTDAGNIGTLHGASYHRELAAMVEIGMTPQAVLLAATRDAARVFSAEPEIGTLEPGRLGDFLVLPASPLAAIENLERAEWVVKGGVGIKPEQLAPANPAWVVAAQVDAYNARDIERFVALYAPNVVVERHPSAERLATGREELRRAYGELFAQSPALHCRVVERVVEGGYVVDHELVTGLRDRPDLRAVAIYKVQAGLIERVWLLQ